MNRPYINVEKTGQNIKNLMKKEKLSVRKLATLMDFQSPYAIYKWFRGDGLPSIDSLVMLSAIFNLQIEDILVIDF